MIDAKHFILFVCFVCLFLCSSIRLTLVHIVQFSRGTAASEKWGVHSPSLALSPPFSFFGAHPLKAANRAQSPAAKRFQSILK